MGSILNENDFFYVVNGQNLVIKLFNFNQTKKIQRTSIENNIIKLLFIHFLINCLVLILNWPFSNFLKIKLIIKASEARSLIIRIMTTKNQLFGPFKLFSLTYKLWGTFFE